MKVNVTLHLDVDEIYWQLIYNMDKKDVRKDVKHFVTEIVKEHFEKVGVVATVIEGNK